MGLQYKLYPLAPRDANDFGLGQLFFPLAFVFFSVGGEYFDVISHQCMCNYQERFIHNTTE